MPPTTDRSFRLAADAVAPESIPQRRLYTGALMPAIGSGTFGSDHASPEMIAVARKNAARAKQDVAFDVGLAEQLAFPDESFDVVISRLAIHHLPDDLKRKAFAEILRVLRPGGRLLIADFTPPANPLLNHIATAMVGSHMMQTDITKLPPMLESAGFAEVRSGPTASAFLAFVAGKKPIK